MALDATLGGATANSYITRAVAEAYFQDRLDADAWETAMGDGTADASLIMATQLLETESYLGQRATTTQALAWPRAWVPKYDNYGYYTTTELPPCITVATCELALSLLKDPSLVGAAGIEGFSSLTLGDLTVTPTGAGSSPIARFVHRFLAPVLIVGARVERA